jgi:hypothetical protein
MTLKVVVQVMVEVRVGVFQLLMKPKLLSWNVRGLNDRNKWLRVRNLLRELKVDVVCFQETKPEVMTCSVVCNLWDCHHVVWCCLDTS